VSLHAPDALILERVKATLKEARKSHPISTSKPGRKAANARYDERTFAHWLSLKIVQLAELWAWRNRLDEKEQKRFPNAALGSWLDFDDKKTSQAVSLMWRVINDDFRALNKQAVAEAGGDSPARS
jgi:hypothetical protein